MLVSKVEVLREQLDLMSKDTSSLDMFLPLDMCVKDLLQEAQIYLQESHQDKLEKENLKVLKLYVTRLEEVKSSLQHQLCPLLLKELYAALIAHT